MPKICGLLPFRVVFILTVEKFLPDPGVHVSDLLGPSLHRICELLGILGPGLGNLLKGLHCTKGIHRREHTAGLRNHL